MFLRKIDADRLQVLIQRTPNPDCPGCLEFRLHTKEEKRQYHPLAGHGYVDNQGWTHPELRPRSVEIR